jgi:hypothetical protein
VWFILGRSREPHLSDDPSFEALAKEEPFYLNQKIRQCTKWRSRKQLPFESLASWRPCVRSEPPRLRLALTTIRYSTTALSRGIKVSKVYKSPGFCSLFGSSKSRKPFCKFLVTFLQQVQAVARLMGGDESAEDFFTCSDSACRDGADLVAENIWFPTLRRRYKNDRQILRSRQSRRLYAHT